MPFPCTKDLPAKPPYVSKGVRHMDRILLGILTLYLNDTGVIEEKRIYEQMTRKGAELGINVILFTPQDVDSDQNKVRAHKYDLRLKRWRRVWTRIPILVFDRCRIQRTPRFKQLKEFKTKHPKIVYLNKPIGNKWTAHLKLNKHPQLSAYLPYTKQYAGLKDLRQMLNQYGLVYLKPISGTGGRGILRLERISNQQILVQGRDLDRNIIQSRKMSLLTLYSFIEQWNHPKIGYLIQQGIPLKLSNGRVHDYRLLVQKDGTGNWQVTGSAGRIGAPQSITANLHGGGSAVPMQKLMNNFLPRHIDIVSLQHNVEQIGLEIAQCMEDNELVLCEIAIDIAIDKEGKIWIIELNPKPSREVFKEIGELDTYHTAISRPLEYALYQYNQKVRHL